MPVTPPHHSIPRASLTARTPKQVLESGAPLVHLKISECCVTAQNVLVTTVLGSCVSVTFYDTRRQRLAAMFHAMLPEQEAGLRPGPSGERADACKYVDASIHAIMRRFERAGAPLRDLELKLFGGAMSLVTEQKQIVRDIVDVGAKNVAAARRALAEYGLAPVRESVLGPRGRKLFFHTGTGVVWMKFLKSQQALEQQLRTPSR